MKLTAEELKTQIDTKLFKKLFDNGHPSGWVTYKINGWIIEYRPKEAMFYLGWEHR